MSWRQFIAALVLWTALAGRADALAGALSGGVEYRSADGAFTLSFPYEPTVESSTDRISGTTVRSTWIKALPFGLIVQDFGRFLGVLPIIGQLDLLTAPREGRTIEYVRTISLGSVPGREILMSEGGVWIRQRFYWVDGRLYTLMSISETKNEREDVDRYFFDFFRLSPK